MSKVNCEIVRDLIPSYLDGICSQSSREAVEEHVENCGECRESLETLRRTSLGGDRVQQGELNLMKKVKRHYVRKSMLIVGGMALAMLLFGNLFDFELWYRQNLYYVMFPLVALGTYALLLEYPIGTVKRGKRLRLGGVSVFGVLYGIILAIVLCWKIPVAAAHLEMNAAWLGPFMEFQLTGIVIAELAMFVWFVADSLKNQHALDGLYIISLLGAFMSMVLRLALRYMCTSAELQRAVIQMLVIVFVEGLGIAILEVCVSKYQVQKSGK